MCMHVKPVATCGECTCCLSWCMSLSFSRLRAITSSWDFFRLEADNSSRAMLASFSLMAASNACCLQGEKKREHKRITKRWSQFCQAVFWSGILQSLGSFTSACCYVHFSIWDYKTWMEIKRISKDSKILNYVLSLQESGEIVTPNNVKCN